MPDTFFCRSLIRAHTGSFRDKQKFCDLLVEVGHMTKWWVCGCNELFGSNFLRSLIKDTHRKLCKCVWRHFSPIYESRSNFEVVWKWVMGPSWCPSLFFGGSLIRADTGSFKNVQKHYGLLVEVGHMTKWWVLSCNKLFGSNFWGH